MGLHILLQHRKCNSAFLCGAGGCGPTPQRSMTLSPLHLRTRLLRLSRPAPTVSMSMLITWILQLADMLPSISSFIQCAGKPRWPASTTTSTSQRRRLFSQSAPSTGSVPAHCISTVMEHACLLPFKAWCLCNLLLVLNNAAADIGCPVCHVILPYFTMFALLSIHFCDHMLLLWYTLKLMDLVCIEYHAVPCWSLYSCL